MKTEELMTRDVRCIGPGANLIEAAALMRQLDVGALPICDDDRLSGMITDRDLVVRGVAEKRDPLTTTVGEVMSDGVIYGFADQDADEVARIMHDHKIRRLPIVNREKRLVGIVALADVAGHMDRRTTGTITKAVSEPHEPSS
ncbi:CBS domain-containing protein [Congregicoccus parvus]|uniref:CBS domain-containing protein n=1 Tax=Congregicoccus parvus TaxID=3081749 RepID=UPI003FA55AB4